MFGQIDLSTMQNMQVAAQICAQHPGCKDCEILQPNNKYNIVCENTGRTTNEEQKI